MSVLAPCHRVDNASLPACRPPSSAPIAAIEREQDKIKREAKEAARKGETGAVKAMAKNIVMSNKAIERMHITKANLNSVLVTLQTQGGAFCVRGLSSGRGRGSGCRPSRS